MALVCFCLDSLPLFGYHTLILPFVTPPPLSVHVVLFGGTAWGRGACDPGLPNWSHSEVLREDT